MSTDNPSADGGGKDTERPPRNPRPCPMCSKMSVERYHPFCSKRCADIDLGKWLGGRYAVPVEEPPDFADMGPPEGDDEDR
jgi:hypothetical protein